MNCLASRRMLLAAPRERTAEHVEHLAACQSCSRLATELAALEQQIDEAALVPVPDALADRVLMTHRGRRAWRFGIAAMLALAIGVSGMLLPDIDDFSDARGKVDAVGPAHPAVAAITLVMDEQPELPNAGNAADMEQELKRLGLSLKEDTYAYYVGKCQLPGSDCDLITLSTRDAYANVVLVRDYPVSGRIVVEDRRRVAMMNPAKDGAYIVVAETPVMAKRIQKAIVKG